MTHTPPVPRLDLVLTFTPALPCALCYQPTAHAAAIHEDRWGSAIAPYVLLPCCLPCVPYFAPRTLASFKYQHVPPQEQMPTVLRLAAGSALACIGVDGSMCVYHMAAPVVNLYAVAITAGVWAVWPRCPACLSRGVGR